MRLLCFSALLFLLTGSFGVAPLAGQSSLESICDRQDVTLAGAGDECLAAVQAAISAQPALGLVIAGGNPTLGTAGGAGLRLGVLPRVSAGLRLNVVGVGLPDIVAAEIPGTVGDITRRFGAPAPALIGDASIALTEGFGFAPGLGGIGAISVLGSAALLPFRALGVEGFEDSPDIAWGIGGRLHLLQESFVAPGISVSVMRRQLATVRFGDVCPGTTVSVQDGEDPETGTFPCATEGDPGEVEFDLGDWSGRLVASKHLLGFGLTAGIGYDEYSSDVGLGFRSPERVPGTNTTIAFRSFGHELESSRWILFGNASYSLLVATIAAEAGWQQWDAPITGFRNIGSDFDPESGTWFGSIGVRVGL